MSTLSTGEFLSGFFMLPEAGKYKKLKKLKFKFGKLLFQARKLSLFRSGTLDLCLCRQIVQRCSKAAEINVETPSWVQDDVKQTMNGMIIRNKSNRLLQDWALNNKKADVHSFDYLDCKYLTILQLQFYNYNVTVQYYNRKFTIYKCNFTSFARSTTGQMPALVWTCKK
jgi:hypothetical protein